MSLPLSGDVLTPRLALIPITPVALHSEQASDGQLTNLIHSEVPFNWPPADWEPQVFTILLAQYERFPSEINLHRYIALLQPQGTRILIGCAGAFRNEVKPDECEIGYSILPPYEGRGLATEAAQALITLIRHTPGITSIIAHTFSHLTASIRIMQKCGLTPDGHGAEPGTIRYRLIFGNGTDAQTSQSVNGANPTPTLTLSNKVPSAQFLNAFPRSERIGKRRFAMKQDEGD